MNPPVSGNPAKPSMNVAIEKPSSGRSQPKPARLSSVTGSPSSRSRATTTAKAPTEIAEYGIR